MLKFERIFAGFVTLSGVTGAPGATVTLKASTVPLCGDKFATAAAAAGRPYCNAAHASSISW